MSDFRTGVLHTRGVPTKAPSSLGPRVAVDVVTGTVYSYDGSAWEEVGGSAVPTLQEVTTEGATTDEAVVFGESIALSDPNNLIISGPDTTDDRTYNLPDRSGTIRVGADYKVYCPPFPIRHVCAGGYCSGKYAGRDGGLDEEFCWRIPWDTSFCFWNF